MGCNVVVTGAAGFLGSHIARFHLDRGDRVMGVDNFCSSHRGSEHLRLLRAHVDFDFWEGDITERSGWWECLQDFFPQRIYNFACPASPPIYQRNPVHTMLTCVIGTKNVLEAAERTGALVVHASTSEVYGDPSESPQAETYRGSVNPFGPRACYDEGKRAAEALCWDYRAMGVDARLVRIFNTYGPGMLASDGRVITNFISQLLQGRRMTIYGDGSQTRSLCYVDDLVRGIVALADSRTSIVHPINLGNPNELTVHQLAQEIASVLGFGAPHQSPGELDLDALGLVERRPLPQDDPCRRCPDISRARELLGWEPRVALQAGIRMTAEHLRREMNGAILSP